MEHAALGGRLLGAREHEAARLPGRGRTVRIANGERGIVDGHSTRTRENRVSFCAQAHREGLSRLACERGANTGQERRTPVQRERDLDAYERTTGELTV
jgi:hypothetical protein